MATVSVTLPDDLLKSLDAICELENVPRDLVIVDKLSEYVDTWKILKQSDDSEIDGGFGPNFIEVDPGDLRLPPGRAEGPLPKKWSSQVTEFGSLIDGMPTIEVTLGKDNEMVINSGVTRATRVFFATDIKTIRVEIIGRCPTADLSRYKRVRDLEQPFN